MQSTSTSTDSDEQYTEPTTDDGQLVRSSDQRDAPNGDGSPTQKTEQPSTNADGDETRWVDADEETDEHTATKTCPECGDDVRRDDSGERICTGCGLVVSKADASRGPEWYTQSAGERERDRTGQAETPTRHDRGLSTSIDRRNVDSSGNTLSSRKRAQMNRLRKWDERFRTRDGRERNLKQALGEIDRMASALGLPDDVRETASVIYRRALEDGFLPGRSIEAVGTAALYAATRQAGVPRTMSELASVSRISANRFERAYRDLQRELGLEISPPDPRNHIHRIISELGLRVEVERQAREILETGMDEELHSGRHPAGLSAASVYLAGLRFDESLSQQQVADAANVSRATVRKRYEELLDLVEQ